MVGVPGLDPSVLVLPGIIFSGLVPLVRAFSLVLSDSLEDFIGYVLYGLLIYSREWGLVICMGLP